MMPDREYSIPRLRISFMSSFRSVHHIRVSFIIILLRLLFCYIRSSILYSALDLQNTVVPTKHWDNQTKVGTQKICESFTSRKSIISHSQQSSLVWQRLCVCMYFTRVAFMLLQCMFIIIENGIWYCESSLFDRVLYHFAGSPSEATAYTNGY